MELKTGFLGLRKLIFSSENLSMLSYKILKGPRKPVAMRPLELGVKDMCSWGKSS